MRWRKMAGVLIIVGAGSMAQAQGEWQTKVRSEVQLMGHRNWIAVVDSAYPLQSASGIETIETNEEQPAVLDYVLDAVRHSPHVRALAHTDLELQYVPGPDAPGVGGFRAGLAKKLDGLPTDAVLHQSLIDELNVVSQKYHVLVLKTRMTIPYSSVFLQLDCRYWSDKQEARMRKAMQADGVAAAKQL